MMSDHNDKLLSTVYWSLGVIFTITILLIGFGWFANFKIYERDKDIIRQEITGHLKTEFLKLTEDNETRINENINKIKEISKSHGKDAANNIKSELMNIINNNSSDINDLMYEMYSMKASNYESREIYNNALYYYLKIIQLSIKMKYEWRVANTLDKIKSLCMQKSFKPTAEDITDLTSMFNDLPSKFSIVIKEIKDLLGKRESFSE